jgi:hypothetical protein
MTATAQIAAARVNGIPLHAPGELLDQESLRQRAWVNALRQYLQLLAGAAVVEGVALDAAGTPLVQ